MKIKKVIGREIFDSRGLPTIECELILDNDISITAAAPSGASRGTHEAKVLRDEKSRLMGKGCLKAVKKIEQVIEPAFIGRQPNTVQLDALLLELDDTNEKSNLGANTMIATSMAVCKAHALSEGMEPYEMMAYLCGFETVGIPGPMFNMINGGAHANNNLKIQEIMLVPLGLNSFREAMEVGSTVFYTLKQLLHQQGKSISVGDEGGFAPNFNSETEAIDSLMMAIDIVQKQYDCTLMLALDMAASQFYDVDSQTYSWQGRKMKADGLVKWYEKLIKKYPIYSIEDGLSEFDWNGWEYMSSALSGTVKIVGDDIFATNPQRIWDGIERDVADTVIIKPDQIGTVTEALQSVKLCQEYNINTIVSHRSGETNDTFIADMAVAVSADQMKAGGCSRGERMAK